jgi:K+-transporting ATPase ATPase A chain
VSGQGVGQILFFVGALIALAYPLGLWMARVYGTFRAPGPLRALERGFYRLVGTDARDEQTWRSYGKTVLVFSVVGTAVLYGVQRLQASLLLNPDHLKGVPPHISLNTAVSFVTNTSWQFYGGESTMSYFTQTAGIAVQMFVSGAVGMAVLAAVVRGFGRRSARELGNFWVDFYRSIVYVLLPLTIVLAVVFVWQGVPQTFAAHATGTTLEGAPQTIARGPVALLEAVKNLSMDGGGFFNSNSATPFENPNGLTNLLEMLSLLLIPVAQVFMFGRMIGNRRHARAVFAAMLVLLVAGIGVTVTAEQHGSQVLRASGVDLVQSSGQSGGNMSDKEVRFGIANTALFATATTAGSDGAVNGGLDAFTPAGGAVPLLNIFVGEVIFGGVGSGLYSMLFVIVLAVFVAGLMIGRTPEYLDKKIEAREVKLAALGALFVPTLVLALTAITVVTHAGLRSVFNTGAHGFTEALYAWTSMTNTNGSAFAGFGGSSFTATLGAVAMILGRFVPLVAALALGGSLATKRASAPSAGTLRAEGPTFATLLVGMIVLTSGLMILPALSLGPIVEGLAP